MSATDDYAARAAALATVSAAADALDAAEAALRDAVRQARATGATLDDVAVSARRGRATIARWQSGDPRHLPPRKDWQTVLQDALSVVVEHGGDSQQVMQGMGARELAPTARRLQLGAKQMSDPPAVGSADAHTLTVGLAVAAAVLDGPHAERRRRTSPGA